jgi:CHAT domain-containing protein
MFRESWQHNIPLRLSRGLSVRRKALYLGANPPGTVSLGLDEEVRAIKQELRSARYRCFDLVACWASEANDLVRELRESTPAIVHLSGHACKAGGRAGEAVTVYRDVFIDPAALAGAGLAAGAGIEGGGGLVLNARDGSPHVVSYEVVKKIFELAGSSVKLVVLTACSTEPLASLLLEHVDCAIGIDGPISDRAALEFSKGLYAALGDGAAIEQAFQAGCLAILCAGLPGAGRPKLKVRDGVDPSRVVLAAIPRRRKARSRRPPWPVARPPGKHPAPRVSGATRRRSKLEGPRIASSALQRKPGRHR